MPYQKNTEDYHFQDKLLENYKFDRHEYNYKDKFHYYNNMFVERLLQKNPYKLSYRIHNYQA